MVCGGVGGGGGGGGGGAGLLHVTTLGGVAEGVRREG